ncbi:hypothetical protein U0O11_01195 [Cobetia sp. D5]|uniref:hypothetical protein n=1 Tax=Cobetia sp. D5 TaxID=3105867 RepID=UPI002D775998|nr:hypothetical protein [Cobetia sp. D5]
MHISTLTTALTSLLPSLLLGLTLMFATPTLVAADDRHRAQGQHGERHSTPQSRHEAIKRRHLRMFDEPRVERHHSRHDIRRHVPKRRYHQHGRLEHDRYRPYYYQNHDSGRHGISRYHNGVSIGIPAIRININ